MIASEKETILLTSEADDTWEIYTFNHTLLRKLHKYADVHPEDCKLKSEDIELGCATYTVRKDRISIRFMEPISEEQREKMRERGKANAVFIKKEKKE